MIQWKDIGAVRWTGWASDDQGVCFVEGYHRWCWARAVAPWCLVSSSTAVWELPGDVVVDKPLTPLTPFLYLPSGDSHITDLKGLMLDQVSKPCTLLAQHTLNKAIIITVSFAIAPLGIDKASSWMPPPLPSSAHPLFFCCRLPFTFIPPPPPHFLPGVKSIHSFVRVKQTSNFCGSALCEAERRKTGSACK